MPGLILILRLAAGLTVDPGSLLDGLPVPQRTGGIGQAVAMIVESPGIGIATLAEKMGLATNDDDRSQRPWHYTHARPDAGTQSTSLRLIPDGG